MKKWIVFSILIVLACVTTWVYLYRERPLSRKEHLARQTLKFAINSQLAYVADYDTFLMPTAALLSTGFQPLDNVVFEVLNADQTSLQMVAYSEQGDRAFMVRGDLESNSEQLETITVITKEEAIAMIRKAKEDELAQINLYLPDLQNPDPIARRVAAEALSKIKNERIVDPLIEALKDTDADTRAIVAEALGLYPRAIEPLTAALLKDTDTEVRGKAATALGMIKDERIVAPLVEAMKTGEKPVQEAAVDALINQPELFNENTTDYLIDFLECENSILKAFAVERLRAMEYKMEYYHKQVSNPRIFAWEEKAVIPLIRLLGDKLPQIKNSAAYSLGEIGDTRAVLPLVEALENTQSMIPVPGQKGWYDEGELNAAESMCTALGKLKDNRSVAILHKVVMNLDLLESWNGLGGRHYAVNALCEIAKAHEGQKSNPAADALKGIVLNQQIEKGYRNSAEKCLKEVQ